MARYSATIKRSPPDIMKMAMEHFGVRSGSMQVVSKTDRSLCLESVGGYVTINLRVGVANEKMTEMDVETDHFDDQVVEFIRIV